MSPLWRRVVACLSVASLLLASFPADVLANTAAPAVAPIVAADAMKYMRDLGVYSGDDDLLKTYLQGPDNRLTPIGEALYRSLRARYNAAEAVEALRPSFDKLRQSGPYDATKRQTTERALASFQEKFGDVSRRADDGTVEGGYQWGTLLEAYMSGLATGEPPKGPPNYTQIALADGSGHEFWDEQGLAFRINQHRVTTYNRDLQKAQRAMNADRPRQVPFIPETGRYNFEMLQYSYWRLKNQYDDIELALRVDRMSLMAQLLGIQVKDDRFYLDPKLMEELETKAKASRRYHRDRYWTVFEVVEKRMEQRRYYLQGADAAVKLFETDMNRLKGAATMTDAQVQSMTLDEKNALRWLSLSVLATQEYAIRNQMEVLDPTSPDSQMLQEALRNSPLSAETRRRYAEQSEVLRRRLEALQGLLTGVRRALNASDYAGSLDMVQAALGSAQRELGEISADYSLFVEAPSGAFLAASETGINWLNGQPGQPWGEGWSIGNWGPKLWGNVNRSLGTAQGAKFDRLMAQVPAYDCITRAIAKQTPLEVSCVLPLVTADLRTQHRISERSSWADLVKLADALPEDHCVVKVVKVGGMAAARCLTIAMNPDAARRFQEVRFAGGNEAKVTDAVRIAASLRANRMDLADVASSNKWVRTGASYLTWTVTLALGGPVITGVLRPISTGFQIAANGIAKIPVVGAAAALPFRMAEGLLTQIVDRTAQLNPARSQLPASMQTSMLGRYVASSGIRWVNAAGRQASFTGLSAVISTGFTVGQHAWDGESSNFSGYADAAWQGFSGGVVWANDSFHPALGYIGVPSSAFAGIRYVAPAAENLAARGALGNVAAALDGALGRWVAPNTFSRLVSMEAAASGQWATRLLGENVLGRSFQQLSKVGAFGFAMTDQIAKYVVFSKGVSIISREMTYANGLDDNWFGISTDYVGLGRGERTDLDDAETLSRRLKRSHASAHAMEMSPIWLLLPVFPARQAIQGAMYQRAAEGMRQYDMPRRGADGKMQPPRTFEYANATEGTQLRFLDARPKPPLSQRIFEWSWRTQENSDVWIVTKEARSAGIRKALYQEVGAVDGSLKGVNPRRFVEIMNKADNAKLDRTNLAVNDEVKELARKNLAEVLVANPELTRRILDAKLGSTVEGFGVVNRPIRSRIAETLHMAESTMGVKVPKDILSRLGPSHERYVKSDRLPQQPAADAINALKSVGKKSPGLDKAADFLADSVARWREGKYPERIPNAEKELPITEAQWKAAIDDYNGLLVVWRAEMRARLQRGEMTAKELNVVEKFFDAITAIESRFNSFNNPATVREVTKEIVDAIKTEYASGSQAARDAIAHFEKGLAGWKPGEGPVAGRGAAGDYAKLIADFEAVMRAKSSAMRPAEQAALQEAVREMKNAPWAVRDKGGNPLPGWRPEQFESFSTALAMMIKQGKGGEPIRLFQMLKTGGGKTMLTYEGLLPFAMADAKNNKMEVAFLTVQSNLEAQARADFFAYKKMDSKLTFDTYEGLKTKIAEGKTKGIKALHRYWILGDEMDGAALQPALTIGEVTARITRRSSVYERINELELDLSARLESALHGQGGMALMKARDIKAEVARLETANPAAIEDAVSRLVRSAEDLQRAPGPEAALRAQRGLLRSSERLRSLIENVPTSQAESALSVRRLVDDLERAVTEPPAPRSRDALAAVAELARDMRTAFRLQNNVMQLAGSEAGLQRLVAEARTMRMAGEQRVERMRGDMKDGLTAEALQRVNSATQPIELLGLGARDYVSPRHAQTSSALAAEIKLVKAEIRLAERFEGVDAGARVLSLTERQVALDVQVRRGEGGPQAPGKLAEITKQIDELTAGMPKERLAAHKQHKEAIENVYKTGEQMGAVDAAIAAAAREGKPVEALKARLSALEAERATHRARVNEKAAELGSGAADGAMGPGLQRLRILRGQITETTAQAEMAASRAEKPGTSASDVAAARRQAAEFRREARRLEGELQGLSREIQAKVRTIFKNTAIDDVLAAASKPGNEAEALRLLAARRRLMEKFAGDENPIYQVYRQMKNDMEPIATNKQVLNEDPAIHNPAGEILMRKVDGAGFFTALPSIMKMTYQVFAGKPVTVPVETVGLTRLYTAKLLKALFADPIMPAGQRQTLFWTMLPSWFAPRGIGGRSSWVRTELLNLGAGFHENAAGIRMDGITGQINVVHNGQWFESMDNSSRRFWELHYNADQLTMPYTHRSISTIRDLTMDRRARFISFSGTAGEKFRDHLLRNKVTLAGQGSVAPGNVKMDIRPGQSQKIASIREAINEAAALSRDHVVLRNIDQMPPSVKAEVDAYIAARADLKGKDAAVLRISEFSTQATRDWLTALRAKQPQDTSLVVLSVSDTHMLKLVRKYLIRTGKMKESEIAMVFSDAEHLRLNRPDAKVHEQMNLAGLEEGTVRVLILDTRVGGRGLDLNYKGDKRGIRADPFRGYSNYKMLVIDPHEMSAVHLLQAQGRIDMGRVLAGAHREFSMVMDVKAVQGEAVFRRMFSDSPFFVEMRKDPGLEAFARSRGATKIDWALVHDYIAARELTAAPEAQSLGKRYRDVVQEHLERRQLEVEENQLRSSSVSDDPATSPGRYPGLQRFAPGR